MARPSKGRVIFACGKLRHIDHSLKFPFYHFIMSVYQHLGWLAAVCKEASHEWSKDGVVLCISYPFFTCAHTQAHASLAAPAAALFIFISL